MGIELVVVGSKDFKQQTSQKFFRGFQTAYFSKVLELLQTVSAFKVVLSIKSHVGSTEFNCIFKLCRLSKSENVEDFKLLLYDSFKK